MKLKVTLGLKENLNEVNECHLCVFDAEENCPNAYCGTYGYFVITEIEREEDE